ncbi:MAG: antitoxin [Propionibacteriales bacterium]|nr:antitoxin [Propionibacteriales bacterium]
MSGLVQIRNVPDEARLALKARAAARGESFNEYLLKLLVENASRPTVQEVLARAAARSEKATASAVEAIWAERDDRGGSTSNAHR